MSLQNLRASLDAKRMRYQLACTQIAQEKQILATVTQEIADVEEAQRIAQVVAQQLQRTAHARIATVVSRCLAAVFEDPYTFEIEFRRARGKTEARLLFVQNGHRMNPLRSGSGGARDVASLALRLASLALERPRRRLVLILDEPMRSVHGAGNRQRLAELVEVLAEEYGVQVVLATGLDYLRIGNVISL